MTRTKLFCATSRLKEALSNPSKILSSFCGNKQAARRVSAAAENRPYRMVVDGWLVGWLDGYLFSGEKMVVVYFCRRRTHPSLTLLFTGRCIKVVEKKF